MGRQLKQHVSEVSIEQLGNGVTAVDTLTLIETRRIAETHFPPLCALATVADLLGMRPGEMADADFGYVLHPSVWWDEQSLLSGQSERWLWEFILRMPQAKQCYQWYQSSTMVASYLQVEPTERKSTSTDPPSPSTPISRSAVVLESLSPQRCQDMSLPTHVLKKNPTEVTWFPQSFLGIKFGIFFPRSPMLTWMEPLTLRIDLYVKYDVVKRGIPSENAVEVRIR